MPITLATVTGPQSSPLALALLPPNLAAALFKPVITSTSKAPDSGMSPAKTDDGLAIVWLTMIDYHTLVP
jgi:hypothetical protein